MSKLLLLGVLVACTKEPSRPPPGPEPAAVAAKPVPASPTPAAPPADSDDAFRAAATEVATARHLVVDAWGSAELDDRPGADRWAQLSPDPEVATGVDDHGAYLVQASGKHYLIRFDTDGRTKPWMASGSAAPPAWTTVADPFIAHQQPHHGGFEEHHLAIRSGEVVVLRTSKQDRGDDGPNETEYADGMGACAEPCPRATQHGFAVSSAATTAALLGRP